MGELAYLARQPLLWNESCSCLTNPVLVPHRGPLVLQAFSTTGLQQTMMSPPLAPVAASTTLRVGSVPQMGRCSCW